MTDSEFDWKTVAAEYLADKKMLSARLQEVRDKFDDADDQEWPLLLVQLFMIHSRTLGIDSELLVPLFVLRCQFEDEIRRSGKKGRPKKKIGEANAMAYAAATVTWLMQSMDKTTAEYKVAKAIGIKQKLLNSFRDNINRRSSETSASIYDIWIEFFEGDKPTEKKLLEDLGKLRKFV